MPATLLEVCIESAEDARVAEAGGADRLELNSALCVGGLTPSAGMMDAVRGATRLPVIAMIRPRPGGFCYSEAEFGVMLRDVSEALGRGMEGIAFGVLTSDGGVDAGRASAIVRAAHAAIPRPATVFHRAFDLTSDPFLALQQLIDLGVRRVLTSGQRPLAAEGAGLLARLVDFAAGRIEILPASGIRPWNAAALLSDTGCVQVHASLREAAHDEALSRRTEIRFDAPPAAGTSHTRTSLALVQATAEAIGRRRNKRDVDR